MQMHDLIAGYGEFRDKKFKKFKNRFIDLVDEGQSPKVLFIACSDSRVDPALITNSAPGDLFVLRNIGNMVPPFSPDDDFHATAAGIEYAVSVLGVTDIIVCGHSHCGAIDGVYQTITDPNLIHVKKWLELGQKARNYVEQKLPIEASHKQRLEMTEKISVIFQLTNLLTYPAVSDKVEAGELFLRGWYYKIKTGELEYYDDDEYEFKAMLSHA